jgi:hypothetical protein
MRKHKWAGRIATTGDDRAAATTGDDAGSDRASVVHDHAGTKHRSRQFGYDEAAITAMTPQQAHKLMDLQT